MAAMFGQKRGIFGGLVVVTLAVIITVSVLAVVLNNNCQRAFWDGLAVYPGAERIEEESAFLGVQRAVYHSADAPEMIDDWYRGQQASQMRDAVTSGNFSGVKQEESFWTITPDTERGGSLIILAATCP